VKRQWQEPLGVLLLQKRSIFIVSVICTHRPPGYSFIFVKTLISFGATTLFAASILTGTVLADPPTNQTSEGKQKVEERAIFITGSLIPQRVKVWPIGTTTVSPIRIIDRREIDQTGRRTTPGILINEPSLHVIGH
jgi:hypothetical protein